MTNTEMKTYQDNENILAISPRKDIKSQAEKN